jgi:hypothetical protein
MKLKSNRLPAILWKNTQIEFDFRLVEVRVSYWLIDILQLRKTLPPAGQTCSEGGWPNLSKFPGSHRNGG